MHGGFVSLLVNLGVALSSQTGCSGKFGVGTNHEALLCRIWDSQRESKSGKGTQIDSLAKFRSRFPELPFVGDGRRRVQATLPALLNLLRMHSKAI